MRTFAISIGTCYASGAKHQTCARSTSRRWRHRPTMSAKWSSSGAAGLPLCSRSAIRRDSRCQRHSAGNREPATGTEMYRVPRATYRLQLNAGFTFADAKRVVPYLAELGISDLYLSPILKARKGSAHGYDVVDAVALNPELGSEEDFASLHEEAAARGLGLLLDVVPNHMAATQDNAWWMSVLENGPHSRFLHYFDIDWNPVTTRGQTVNKVLLPILGKPYGDALESHEIQLGFDADGFFFRYYDKRLPLAPQSYNRVLRDCVDSLPKEGVAIELRELVEGDATVSTIRSVICASCSCGWRKQVLRCPLFVLRAQNKSRTTNNEERTTSTSLSRKSWRVTSSFPATFQSAAPPATTSSTR